MTWRCRWIAYALRCPAHAPCGPSECPRFDVKAWETFSRRCGRHLRPAPLSPPSSPSESSAVASRGIAFTDVRTNTDVNDASERVALADRQRRECRVPERVGKRTDGAP